MHLPLELLQRCWILAGPTAVGKSAVGLELAELLGAEVVALDSMTVYRGMDIGTAKPDFEDQSRVPHHLLDVIEPHAEFSLAQYLRAAAVACEGIVGRGRVPLFVGGTGLYLRGLSFKHLIPHHFKVRVVHQVLRGVNGPSFNVKCGIKF